MSESEKFSSPKTLTTFEMDGLFTQEDIDNRYYVMAQCSECPTWTKTDTRDYKFKCTNCGSDKYNMKETRSIRSWAATKDLKKERKPRRPNTRS